jgi:hypothetical protein
VKLFNPSAHRCGYIYVRALRDLVRQKGLKPETGRQAEQALLAALEEMPRPIKAFEEGHEDEIERLLKERTEEEQREQKKEK